MAIRIATPADVDALANISAATYHSTYAGMFSSNDWLNFATPAYFRPLWEADLAQQAEQGPVLVAEQDDKVVGFVSALWIGDRGDKYEELPADAFHELRELYVLKDAQGTDHHHGSRLLLELVKLLNQDRTLVGHAARKNAGIKAFMSGLDAEEHESGTIVLFAYDNWKVEVGRISFYWDISVLLQKLKERFGEGG